MRTEIFAVKDNELMEKERAMETSLFFYNLRSGFWFIGIPSWLFGIGDRTIAAFVDGYDLPYLRKLAQKNTDRLFNSNKYSDNPLGSASSHRDTSTDCNRDTMWLYKRFVDLYGSSKIPTQLPLPVQKDDINLNWLN